LLNIKPSETLVFYQSPPHGHTTSSVLDIERADLILARAQTFPCRALHNFYRERDSIVT
tara:strand:- start:174 stop:350 length:177 start_codon:yes stop_codon:yes gene_type:complete